MKRLLVLVVAALGITVGADSHARPRRHHHPVAAAKRALKHERHRARIRHRPARTTGPLEHESDELVLSPVQLRQLQRNLVDGGYLRTVDGRLGSRTRRALVEFQSEYHLARTGRIDRPTGEALLGRDAIRGTPEKKRAPVFRLEPSRKTPAASYSPTRTTVQYHRPWRA
jgi:hypothetical protein